MRQIINSFNLTTLIILISLIGCKKAERSESSSDSVESPTISGNGNQNSNKKTKAGVITAGEWNDLNNWIFWDTIISRINYIDIPEYWNFNNNNRISVHMVGSDSLPVVDAIINLKRGNTTIFTARTDNSGNAELWVDLFQRNSQVDFSKLSLDFDNGTFVLNRVKPFKKGINEINLALTKQPSNVIEIAFVVDATGSMGDELEFLKTELLDVILRAKKDNPNSVIETASVFYRDVEDEYVTKVSGFTEKIDNTLSFIKDQSADGGGDFPEAVHSALDKSVNELQWAASAKTRLLFLLLDAPPHEDPSTICDLQTSIIKAAEKGIKIIPITASGIDKETEFLMRFISISTNGTYVFITDDSGVGESHIEPTVGEYEVELLNDLMVRLINQYSK